MENSHSRDKVKAVEGKIVSSVTVINEHPHAHGVLLIFTDGTELSINFDPQTAVSTEVLHYRWENDEEQMLDHNTGIADSPGQASEPIIRRT